MMLLNFVESNWFAIVMLLLVIIDRAVLERKYVAKQIRRDVQREEELKSVLESFQRRIHKLEISNVALLEQQFGLKPKKDIGKEVLALLYDGNPSYTKTDILEVYLRKIFEEGIDK